MSRKPSSGTSAWIAGVAVALVITALVAKPRLVETDRGAPATAIDNTPTSSKQPIDLNALPPGLQPFREAEAFGSLSDAVQAHPSVGEDPRPSASFANDGLIEIIWVSDLKDGLSVEFGYSTSVKVQVTPAAIALHDPAVARTRYLSQAEQDAASTNGAAAVVDVVGVPAYLIPDGAAVLANGESQGTPALLQLVIGERNVSIIAHLDDEAMLEIARTMVS